MTDTASALLDGAFDHAPWGMSVLGAADLRRLAVNRPLCEFLGYARDELLGLPVSAVVHPDDFAADEAMRAQLLAGERDRVQRVRRYRHKDGRVLWGDFSCVLVRCPQGQPLHFIAYVQDVTARRQSDLALQESEERFRSLCALSVDCYWEQDAQDRLVRLEGIPQTPDWMQGLVDRLVGTTRWSRGLLERLDGSFGALETLLRQRRPFRGLECRVKAAPRETYVSVSGEPLFGADGAYRGYRGTARNITSRKIAERELKEAQELMRMAVEVGRFGAWTYAVGDRRARCSREAAAILGVDTAPARRQALARFASGHRARVDAVLARCLRHGDPFDLEAAIVRPRGEPGWVRLFGEAEWDSAGRVRRIHGAVQDITDVKQARSELKESQRTLAALMGNLPGMVFRAQAQPKMPLLFASEGAFALTGHPPEALMRGAPTLGSLIDPEDLEAKRKVVEAAIARRERFQVRYRLHTPQGEKWVWEQGVPVFGDDGAFSCLEGFVIDISELRRAQRERDELMRTLEDKVRERTGQLHAANAELEAIAYSMAHDLRAPITSIAGFARILEPTVERLEPQQAHYLRRILRNVRAMGELTDALLSLARLSGMEVQREPVDLGATARELFAQLRDGEPRRAARLEVLGELCTTGQPALLRQLLANLLGNAWKFSSGRQETVVVVAAAPDPAGDATVFSVADNGVGFDMAHAANLFNPFRRLHNQHEFEGTGIGLAVARKVVQLHGGRIWAQAEPGRGATIYFTLAG